MAASAGSLKKSSVLKHCLSRLRYHISQLPPVAFSAYQLPNIMRALKCGPVKLATDGPKGRLALCLRFRDEGRYLDEWVQYYLAAGVDHFFLYNNFSEDNYAEVLAPYVADGKVTLIDWPYKPASPAAEWDCLARTCGRFDWVGFIDTDEFVVVRDGSSLPEYLDRFPEFSALALHWVFFGSAGHDKRPDDWVIRAYTKRARGPNRHFKVFVRPEKVSSPRNSHNFYYRGAKLARREDGSRVWGSTKMPPLVKDAWINHYYCKSREDFMEKASRKSFLHNYGVREQSRMTRDVDAKMRESNEVEDLCAITYYNHLSGENFSKQSNS